MSENSENVTPPRLKDSKKALQQIALTGSSQVVAIDPQVRYRWVRIRASVAISFYLRSNDSGSVDQTLATSADSSSATLGYQLPASLAEDFQLGGQDNYIVVQSSGTGYLQILGSGPQRIVDGSNQGP